MSLWLLGGHDPTHGAGLYRDLVTARWLAPEQRRYFAVTALTEQGRGRPARAWPVPAARLRARVSQWPRPRAIKVGLVPDALALEVAILVHRRAVPVVVDPVLSASDGGSLGATPTGLAPLLAVATVLTPNLSEGQRLMEAHGGSARHRPAEVGGPEGHGRVEAVGPAQDLADDADRLADALSRRFAQAAVLLKGGHGTDPVRVTDRFARGDGVTRLTRPRLEGPDPRGTGCALATAIAVHLARGAPVETAVREAVSWLDRVRQHWVPGPDGQAHLPDRESSTVPPT